MTRRQCLPLLQLEFGVLQRPHLLLEEIGAYLHKPRDGTKLYANPTHTYCCCHSHNVWCHWGITKTHIHVVGGTEFLLQSFVCFDFCIAQSSCIDPHCPIFLAELGGSFCNVPLWRLVVHFIHQCGTSHTIIFFIQWLLCVLMSCKRATLRNGIVNHNGSMGVAIGTGWQIQFPYGKTKQL